MKRRQDKTADRTRADQRYETLAGLLAAYRTPVTIILFGLLLSLTLFFGTLVGHSRAKQREFMTQSTAAAAHMETALHALAVELEELSRALDAGIGETLALEIFTPDIADFNNAIGILHTGGRSAASHPDIARQVRRSLAAADAVPNRIEAPVIVPLPEQNTPGRHLALVQPLASQSGTLVFITTTLEQMMASGDDRLSTAWAVARLHGAPPELLSSGPLSAEADPLAPTVQSLLDTAPFQFVWLGTDAFAGLTVIYLPRRSFLLTIGPLPWMVLGFCLFATMAIGALALKDARRATDVRREVDLKTAELKRSHDIIAAKNEELARFAAHASHDLQAPLRAMQGMSSRLVERTHDLDDRSQDMLQRIHRGAERAQRLVQDLLSYTQADASRARPEPMNPADIVQEIEEALAVPIEESGATLRWKVDGHIQADRFLLTRALQNLVSNAIKYSGERKPVIEITLNCDNEGCTFTVADNGIGIKPEYFDRIFNVFERLHGADRYEGSGIGLALCKRVADLHDGRIWVESEPDAGSRFHLYLPHAAARPLSATNSA
jgi:signal transduction histidine kinase